jgi:sporulation protein YlmC with PRC-barrel domain
MLKTVALSASVLAFASGLAFAETTMTREPSTGRSVVTNPSSSLSTDHWLASDVYKASVYDPSEHKIGNVTDLMIDSNGNVTAAIIGVGGFLGVAEKDVVIPFKELKVSTREGKDWLVLNRTKDELKMVPPTIIRALRASIGLKEAMSADVVACSLSAALTGVGNEAVHAGGNTGLQRPLRVKL